MKSPFWTPHKSDQLFLTHGSAECKGRHCCVHNPSEHHMRDWYQFYRTDTGVMERVCSHGVGHPDPDQPWPKDDPRWVHGCDGCCSSERELPKGDGCPIRIVLDEPTPPCPEISQELLDDPNFQLLAVGNPNIHSCPVDLYIGPDSEQDEEQRWCYADCVSYTLEELGDAAWQTGCPRCGDNCLAEASPVDLELYEAYHQ